MKLNEGLYYCPRCRVEEFRRASPSEKLDFFFERIDAYYLGPAEELMNGMKNCENNGYAASLLLFSAIEGLASVFYFNRFRRCSTRFNRFCIDQLNVDSKDVGKIDFYNVYRCGLAHEGRVKRNFSIAYKSRNLFDSYDDNSFSFNPRVFLSDHLINYKRCFDDERRRHRLCRRR